MRIYHLSSFKLRMKMVLTCSELFQRRKCHAWCQNNASTRCSSWLQFCTVTRRVSFPLYCSLYIYVWNYTQEKNKELAECCGEGNPRPSLMHYRAWNIPRPPAAIRLYWSCEYLASCQLEGGEKKKIKIHPPTTTQSQDCSIFSNHVTLKWASYWRKR